MISRLSGKTNSSIQSKINAYKTQLSSTKIQVVEEKRKLKEAKKHFHKTEKARVICQIVAEMVEREAHKQVSQIVTICLQTVFGNDYDFQLVFKKKRGKTEAELQLSFKGNVLEDPINSGSGGVLDVAGFGLRLACIMLQKPQPRKILVLDEPFKNLHGSAFRIRTRQLLEKLTDDFNVQIIIVTGITDFEIGKVINL
jgi:DNA repair exonuclease SbcCD ATPase subunit